MASAVAAGIPLIDLAGCQDDVARQLVDAAADHGFIYIRNLGHDIPPRDIDDAFALAKRLFDLPVEEKQRCAIQTNNRGWTAMQAETLDPAHQRIGDLKECFNFGEFVDGKAQQPLPPAIAADEPRLSAFADSCRRLCHKLLYLLGLGLDVGDFFSSAHFTRQDGSGSVLRLLHYPPADPAADRPGHNVRAGAHSDYGSITLLFRLRGQAGLEILRKDNTWAPVPVCPPGTESDPSPPILINIADLLSYWTNGLLRSTVHRVVFPADDGSNRVSGESSDGHRYSMTFFCHPMSSTRLEPVPSERVKNYVPTGEVNPNPYAQRRVMTAEEHLLMRLKETYGTLYDDDAQEAPKS